MLLSAARILLAFSPRRGLSPRVIALGLAIGTPAGAAAQYGARANVQRPLAATNREDPSAAGSEIDLSARNRIDEGLQDVMHEVPGARILRAGAPGSFAGLSLRGAESAHTEVVLGDLPISGSDTGSFDFGLLPIELFERVEVFRGGAPLAWSSGAIGGVVRLVPHAALPSHFVLEGGGGSFGSGQGRAFAALRSPRLQWWTSAGARGSKNDYPYFDEGGTLFDPSDDRTRKRSNAEYVDIHAAGQLRRKIGAGWLEALALGLERQGGVPGPAAAPALQAQQNYLRTLTSLAYTHQRGEDEHPERRLQIALGGGYDRNRFDDRFAEIGLGPQLTSDRFAALYARGSARFRLRSNLDLHFVGNLRWDGYTPRDALSPLQVDASKRFSEALATELLWHERKAGLRWELRPSLRVEGSHARLAAAQDEGSRTSRSVDVLAPTYRLAGALGIAPGLTLSSSLANGRRVPSMLELFGNRSTLLANPALDPERSTSVDVGLSTRMHHRGFSLGAELRVFSLWMQDLIRYRRTAQYTAIAENIARARSHGLELGIHGDYHKRLRSVASLNWLRTRDAQGRRLPLRPEWQGFFRQELRLPLQRFGLDALTLYGEVSYLGSNYVDPANLVALNARLWLNAGLRLDVAEGRWALLFSARDLLDERGDDLLGFPLPGRRVFALLRYRGGLP